MCGMYPNYIGFYLKCSDNRLIFLSKVEEIGVQKSYFGSGKMGF